MDFFKCEKCGNIVTYASDVKCRSLTCCGQDMTELKANTTDAAQEKHVPVITASGSTVTVTVGSVAHPMEEKHYITLIAIESEQGVQIKKLAPAKEPKAVFALADGDKLKAAYAYCNLHGLWKAQA